MTRTTVANKNYMSIGVSVRTRMSAARKSGFGVRQVSNPQSPTAYSSVRYGQAQKKKKKRFTKLKYKTILNTNQK